jgi:hypothetical protein
LAYEAALQIVTSYHNAFEAGLFATLARDESLAFAERTLSFTHVFRDRSAATAPKIDRVGDAEFRRFIENIWPNGFSPMDPLSPDKAKQAAKVCARIGRAADPHGRTLPIQIQCGKIAASRPLGSVHKRIAVPPPQLANRAAGGCPYRNPFRARVQQRTGIHCRAMISLAMQRQGAVMSATANARRLSSNGLPIP